MSDNTKFCVSMDGRILDIAKRVAVKRGVPISTAGKTGPFIRFLLERYIKEDFETDDPAIRKI